MRRFHTFTWKDAHYRICSSHVDIIMQEIKNQRSILEGYIKEHPAFLTALTPISISQEAPSIVCRMQKASEKVSVGPMAAVAGCIAQMAAEAAIQHGAKEAVVDNGGDIFLFSDKPIVIGLYAGKNNIMNRIGLYVEPEHMPLAICSSSSQMGHSLSMGNCDLATVLARDAALADAAATFACNLVSTPEDIDRVLHRINGIDGIQGALLTKNNKIGMAGELPRLIKQSDCTYLEKITHDNKSDFLKR